MVVNSEVETTPSVVVINNSEPRSTSPTHCWQNETSLPFATGPIKPAQVIVIGDPKVGKTALLVRFLTRRFIGQYLTNTDMRYTYSVDSLSSSSAVHSTTNNRPSSLTLAHRRPLTVEFIDISHSPIEDHLVATSEASFVIVYNICERSSFLTAKRLVWMIRKLNNVIKSDDGEDVPSNNNNSRRVPVLFVGNKKDLAETHRQVSEDEIEKIGRDCDVIALETSAAADCAGVTTAFNRLLAEMREFVDERRRDRDTYNHGINSCSICGSESSDSLPRRKSILSSLTAVTNFIASRRKRRKPHTL